MFSRLGNRFRTFRTFAKEAGYLNLSICMVGETLPYFMSFGFVAGGLTCYYHDRKSKDEQKFHSLILGCATGALSGFVLSFSLPIIPLILPVVAGTYIIDEVEKREE